MGAQENGTAAKKRIPWRAAIVLLIVSIGAAILLAPVVGDIVLTLATTSSIDEAIQREERLLCETDYSALLAACRQLSDRVSQGQLQPGQYNVREYPSPEVAQWPEAILTLEPTWVLVDDDGRIMIELNGGMLHFGAMAYPADYEPPSDTYRCGDRELIPGLWFYIDDYESVPTVRQRVEALIDRREN